MMLKCTLLKAPVATELAIIWLLLFVLLHVIVHGALKTLSLAANLANIFIVLIEEIFNGHDIACVRLVT